MTTDANRETLKSVLNNLINDKPEEASLDMHNYLTAKMKDVAGLGASTVVADPADTPSETATE